MRLYTVPCAELFTDTLILVIVNEHAGNRMRAAGDFFAKNGLLFLNP